MSQCALRQPRIEQNCVLEGGREKHGLYYGWVMLPLSMAALIATSAGQTCGVSIFNEPIRLSLGLTYGQLAAAYTLGTVFGAIPISYIGRQMDRHGLRRTMLVVVSLFSLTCISTSFVQCWTTLVAAFCFLRMLGPGALSLLSGSTLAFWFDRRLGMVEGFRQVAMALAMASIPGLILYLVSQWGWRGASGVVGLGIWLLLFPATLLLFRNHPTQVNQVVDGLDRRATRVPMCDANDTSWGLTLREALHTRAFWLVAARMAVAGAWRDETVRGEQWIPMHNCRDTRERFWAWPWGMRWAHQSKEPSGSHGRSLIRCNRSRANCGTPTTLI